MELPTRPRSEYTATVRREALEAADLGRMREASDLTRAAMTEDGYARGVLGGLAYGLWGLPMHFIGDPNMIEALTDTPLGAGQWRTMFPQPEAIRLFSWGATLGVGIGQMRKRWRTPGEDVISVEEAEDGSYKIRRPERPIGAHDTRVLRAWDPKYLRNQWWDDTWWLMTADGEIRIEPNDGEWILYMPYGSIKPWEYGAWKALTLAFVLGRDSLFDRSRHAEVLAPVRVGKVPQGTTEKQRARYLKQIREMQRMHSFVLPPGLEYNIVESTHKIGDIYDNIIGWSERTYRLIYTGNETSTTGSKGFSSGDVQERIAKHTLKSFSESFASCLHDGGLVMWGVENYGTPDVPLAQFDCDPPEDKKTAAETLKTAGDAMVAFSDGLKEVGLRPTKAAFQKLAQKFGIEVEEIPTASNKPAIEITPTARENVYRAFEVRAADGYEPIGDDRDNMTVAELEALAKRRAEGGGTPADGTPIPSEPSDPEAEPAEPPTDESAAALAAKMTAHGVERCGHGGVNRCRLCGIERERDFTPDGNGGAVWHVKWRPILRAHGLNGAASAPMLSMGGQA